MARPRHSVTAVIDAMVARIEGYGKDVTPAVVLEYVRHNLTVADYSFDEAMHDGLMARIPVRLKALGYVIADEESRRERLEDCTASEFTVQVAIKQDHANAVVKHLDADREVEQFLTAKAEALGRDVTVGEFADEVAAIYAKHGI